MGHRDPCERVTPHAGLSPLRFEGHKCEGWLWAALGCVCLLCSCMPLAWLLEWPAPLAPSRSHTAAGDIFGALLCVFMGLAFLALGRARSTTCEFRYGRVQAWSLGGAYKESDFTAPVRADDRLDVQVWPGVCVRFPVPYAGVARVTTAGTTVYVVLTERFARPDDLAEGLARFIASPPAQGS